MPQWTGMPEGEQMASTLLYDIWSKRHWSTMTVSLNNLNLKIDL